MSGRERDAIEDTRRSVAERYPEHVLTQLREASRQSSQPTSLSESLAGDDLALIVEPKRTVDRRSPEQQASALEALVSECSANGAAAVSVVTEPSMSAGSIDHLRAARAVTALPLIARDFVVCVGQVLELRVAGADALLIPMLAFRQDEDRDGVDGLEQLIDEAHGLGMEVVLSVRSARELELALETDADVFNIDNRAANGKVDVDLTIDLLTQVPVGNPIISESIARMDEVTQLHRSGVDALLLDEGHTDDGLPEALATFRSFMLGD